MTSATDALGHVSTTLYDNAGNVTETIDQNGNPTFSSYDGLNRLTATTDALTHVVATVYDAVGNVINTTDALSDVTTNVYDALNRLIVTTDAMGYVSSTLYDAVGNVTETIDGNGKATYNAFDALNRLTATTDATTTDVVTTVYDAGGNIIRTTDALGHVTSYAFDALNRMTSTTDALGHVSTTVYDADGDTIRTTDALGHVTSYAFDALNRLTKTTTPAGDVSTTLYDAAADVTETIDGVGSITYNQYDVLNRMIATTDALGGVTTYGFDYVGNQTSVTDPDGNTTTLVYDVVNRQTELIDPLSHSATMAYDAGNRLTSVTDRDGRIDDYAYDKDNRLIGATWIVGGTTVNLFTYTYDADSNELTAANYAGTYTMGYDVLDRPTSIQEPFGLTLTFAYDKDGNRTQVTDSFGGLTSYVYDNDNRLTTEEFGGTGQTPLRINLAYDAGGELTTITRYSNLAGTATVILTVETYTLDGMVKNIEQKSSSGTILENFTYTYDADDRVHTETDNGTLETYTYDADGELLGNGTESYSYDANGNRTNTGYTNSVNQITTDGTWNFSYDAEGNLTKAVGTAGAGTGQTWVYTYDNDNRLIGATDTQTTGGMLLTQATYVYDALNNRIEKDVDTGGTLTIQRYGYDVSTIPSPSVGGAGTEGATDLNAVPLNIWVDLNSSNAVETRYLWGDEIDQLFARVSSGGTAAWYLVDDLGSVRNTTNNSGTLIDTITYDPFGNVLTETSTSNGDRYKFAGMQLDNETSLCYDLDRYYQASIGRYFSEDPSGPGPDVNPYRYVGNDPVNATDPTGLMQRLEGPASMGNGAPQTGQPPPQALNPRSDDKKKKHGKVYVFAVDGFGSKVGISTPLEPTDKGNKSLGDFIVSAITQTGRTPKYVYDTWYDRNGADLAATVDRIKTDDNDAYSKIIIVGYSYGASTVTQVVQSVLPPRKYKVSLVFTIDPVRKGRRIPINPYYVRDFTGDFNATTYADKWVKFYQRTDFLTMPLGGLVTSGVPGIQGLQIGRAENRLVKAGVKGHVNIQGNTQMLTNLASCVKDVAYQVPLDK